MLISTQVVTPEMAAKWLANQEGNRPLNTKAVKGYADDMRAGKWLVTHQAIAFDKNGGLIDGQHRLHAVIRAGVPVAMTIAFGADPATFAVIDIGPRRSSSDLYMIMGGRADNYKMRVAVARAMLHGGDGKAVTREEVAAHAVAQEPVISASIAWLRGDSVGMWMTAPVRAAYACKMLEVGMDVIRPLAEEQSAGLFVDENNALKRLQDRMMAAKMSGRQMSSSETFVLATKAIDFRLRGVGVSKLVFKHKRALLPSARGKEGGSLT